MGLDASKVLVRFDYSDTNKGIEVANGIMSELRVKLGLMPSAGSGLVHRLPSAEVAIAGNEPGPILTAQEVIGVVEAACIKHLLKTLKPGVLGYELVGE